MIFDELFKGGGFFNIKWFIHENKNLSNNNRQNRPQQFKKVGQVAFCRKVVQAENKEKSTA